MTVEEGASLLRDGGLVLLLVLTSWTDTRACKIRNIHTFPAMLVGCVLALAIGGLDGLGQAALGIGVAFGLMFPLFALGVMRAGDAKLLMGIGAFLGPLLVLRALLASCFLFIPFALVLLVAKGKAGRIKEAAYRIWRFFYTSVHPLLVRESLTDGDAVMTPFALVLALATLWVWRTDFLTL